MSIVVARESSAKMATERAVGEKTPSRRFKKRQIALRVRTNGGARFGRRLLIQDKTTKNTQGKKLSDVFREI
jgi:hypothetical protein